MPEESIKASPKPPSDLVDLQHWFSGAVTAPESEKERLLDESKRYITASSKQDTFERVNVYMTDFWPRIIDSMADDFEHVRTACGNALFKDLIRQYITAYPSRSFTLFHVGKSFPQFLDEHYLRPDRAAVLDMAKFDWARCAAFMSENLNHFDPASLGATDGQQLMNTNLKLHPSVSLLELFHTPTKFLPSTSTTWWVVYRKNFQILWKTVPASFAILLQHVQKGGSLMGIVAELQRDTSPEIQTELEQSIQSYFQTAVAQQWLITT